MNRRFGVAATAGLVIGLLAASGALAGWEECDGFEQNEEGGRKGRYCELRQMTLPAAGSLAVDATPNGGIQVEAWDGDEIRVEAKVQVWDANETDARDKAAGIEIVDSGGRLRAESRFEDNWSVSFRIRAPREIDLDLESHNGGVSVAGIRGELRIETHNGGLSLDALAGDVRARTRNGGVSVQLAGDRWEGEGLDVETRNGGIEIEMSGAYSAELETGTVNGRIRIDFPVIVQGEIGRSLTTTLGAGGATIRAKTRNGGVRISSR